MLPVWVRLHESRYLFHRDRQIWSLATKRVSAHTVVPISSRITTSSSRADLTMSCVTISTSGTITRLTRLMVSKCQCVMWLSVRCDSNINMDSVSQPTHNTGNTCASNIKFKGTNPKLAQEYSRDSLFVLTKYVIRHDRHCLKTTFNHKDAWQTTNGMLSPISFAYASRLLIKGPM